MIWYDDYEKLGITQVVFIKRDFFPRKRFDQYGADKSSHTIAGFHDGAYFTADYWWEEKKDGSKKCSRGQHTPITKEKYDELVREAEAKKAEEAKEQSLAARRNARLRSHGGGSFPGGGRFPRKRRY